MKLENIKNSIKLKTRNVRKVIANWIYPESTGPNIIDAQMQYIQMLQDNTGNLYTMMTGMVKPVIELNKSVQTELKTQREDDNKLKN